MATYMVDMLGRSITECAEGMKTHEFSPQFAPFGIIAALGRRWPLLVVAMASGAFQLDLTGAELTGWHNGTTRAKAGRLGHYCGTVTMALPPVARLGSKKPEIGSLSCGLSVPAAPSMVIWPEIM